MTARSFTLADQHWFRDVSGDANPIHVDPAWAAVNFPGEVVVHGVHTVLWAVEASADARPQGAIERIETTFVKPIVIGDVVRLEAEKDGSVLRLLVEDELMLLVRLLPGKSAAPAFEPGGGDVTVPLVERTPASLAGHGGELAAAADVAALGRAFPNAARALGSAMLIGLVRLSTLVGMECPGLRGLFASFAVRRAADADGPLRYRVRRFNPLFSRAEMEVVGSGLRGEIVAYAGRAVADPGLEEIADAVQTNEFAGAAPLILGGSGGLGATAARLLAAGGAAPVVTWHRGREGAERVCAAIEGKGGRCTLLPFDTGQPEAGFAALEAASWRGGEAYYFATPRIFRRALGTFRPDDLALFTDAYVTRFFTFATGLRRLAGERPLTLFYPSTVAVEQPIPDLLEYAMAKAAGERLAHALEQRFKALRIVVARLPRIDTRQTQSFISQGAASPIEAILPWLRKVQSQPAVAP
jgi:NAD(P)-dependent dehydrogenase (short-subunit alcohol dehydrogenase family)